MKIEVPADNKYVATETTQVETPVAQKQELVQHHPRAVMSFGSSSSNDVPRRESSHIHSGVHHEERGHADHCKNDLGFIGNPCITSCHKTPIGSGNAHDPSLHFLKQHKHDEHVHPHEASPRSKKASVHSEHDHDFQTYGAVVVIPEKKADDSSSVGSGSVAGSADVGEEYF